MNNTGFHLRDGALYCDALRVSLLVGKVETPFYLYSLAKLRQNLRAYQDATAGTEATIGYAIKANHNLSLCRALALQGAGAVVVSAHELTHALAAGFPRERLWMHGNGKRPQDIAAALQAGILLSADSRFDLEHINEAALHQQTCAEVLLRVNPDIDPKVHPYISTGMRESKFGMDTSELFKVAASLTSKPGITLRGLHCHLGSTLQEARPFMDAARLMLSLVAQLRALGHRLDLLDLGGGLGIDYQHQGASPPSPKELLSELGNEVQAAGLRLLLEPGRSIVGDAGALISRVLGVKRGPEKSFLVVDASMAQLIRPCLYGAYHYIEPLETAAAEIEKYEVVGPLCESGDFLGKERSLPALTEGAGVAILDAGAYGFSMASRYNLHLFCAEYTVDGEQVTRTRRAERYEDFAACFVDEAL